MIPHWIVEFAIQLFQSGIPWQMCVAVLLGLAATYAVIDLETE